MSKLSDVLSGAQFDAFKQYVTFETVSSRKHNEAEMERAAKWLCGFMEDAGFMATKILRPKTHYPCVLGILEVDPNLPTLLLYGHYDVQPEGELSEWRTDPFTLTAKGDYLFGRGACDNKGQNMAALLAIQELMASKAKLRYNVKFLLDGNEETGSQGLDEILELHKAELDADAVFGIDGVTPDPERAVISYTSKGLVYYALDVYGAKAELHSGYFGGKVPNPANLLTHFLSTVASETSELPEILRGGVQQPSKAELAELRKKTPANEFEKVVRNRFQSIIDIHSLHAGYIEQLKTAIPTKASARFSVRLAPFQDSPEFDKAMNDLAEKFFKKHGVRHELTLLATANPGYTDPASPYVKLASRALTKGFGNEPLLERMSATLPVFEYATRYLEKPFILASFGLPDSNTHAVNENLYLPQFLKAKQFVKSLLSDTNA